MSRISDKEFNSVVLPLIGRNATYREIAARTGLSIGGVRYRLGKLAIRKSARFETVQICDLHSENIRLPEHRDMRVSDTAEM